jgi:hypothetical protein
VAAVPRASDHTFVRFLSLVIAAMVLAGCAGGPDAQQAQALLQQAQAAQLKLRTAAFAAELSVSANGQKFGLVLDGAAAMNKARGGDMWVRMTGNGPGGDDFELTMSKRGSRVTVTAQGETQTFNAKDAAAPKLDSLSSFGSFDFSSCIKRVDVAEGRSLNGEPATRIAGTVDTACVLKAASALGGVAGSSAPNVDFDQLSKYVRDVQATLFVSERTHLLVGALVTTSISAMGQSADVQIRYRLTRVNKPLRFPPGL